MCALLLAPRVRALSVVAVLPFAQAWSDTGLISRDDDWAGVAGVVGYRGDGLTTVAGEDPRSVVADGADTPVDVNAGETDPRAVGLAAGVTEFELPDPVVALQGSATAAAPHLLLSVDTQGRSGVTVRYRLRDVDPSSIANAVQPVALQYRVGASGDFVAVPGGFVADATTGPRQATMATPVSAALPAEVDDEPLVQLRILTTNAVGQDEWVGVDDIEVEASAETCTPPAQPLPSGPPAHPPSGPPAQPPSGPPAQPPSGSPALTPPSAAPTLSDLTLSPATFRCREARPGREPQRPSGCLPEIPLVARGKGRVPGDDPAAAGTRAVSGAPRRSSRAGSRPRRDAQRPCSRGGARPRQDARDPPGGRSLLDPRPPRPQPAPLQRKAARPPAAARVLPPDGPRDRPQWARIAHVEHRLSHQVKSVQPPSDEALLSCT